MSAKIESTGFRNDPSRTERSLCKSRIRIRYDFCAGIKIETLSRDSHVAHSVLIKKGIVSSHRRLSA